MKKKRNPWVKVAEMRHPSGWSDEANNKQFDRTQAVVRAMTLIRKSVRATSDGSTIQFFATRS